MISPGVRVSVIALGRSNPWIDQKIGWQGEVVRELSDLPGHVHVLFDGRDREDIMPVAALRLVTMPSNHVAKQETTAISPDAPAVRVRPNAGDGSGEEHIVRRRGQVGRVVGECQIAVGYRVVAFPGAELTVMIHKSDLLPVDALAKTKTTVRQLGLPL